MVNSGILTRSKILSALLPLVLGCLIATTKIQNVRADDNTQSSNVYAYKGGSADDQIACEMNDTQKKAIAQEALNALARMGKNYEDFNTIYENDYVNSNGVCNYAKGNIGRWWQEAFTKEPAFSDADGAGAKVADGLLGGSTITNKVNNAKKENTDVNLADIKSKIVKTNLDVSRILEELDTLQEGQSIETDKVTNTVDMFKEIFGYECDDFKMENKRVICVRSLGGVGFLSENKDLGTISQVKQKIGKNDQYTQCLAKMDEAVKKRAGFKEARNHAHVFLAALSDDIKKECTCSKASGALIGCTVEDADFDKDNVSERECKDLGEYMGELTICPTCGIFEVILRSAQKLADGAFEKLGSPFQTLVLIGFAIFIAYQTLLVIASPASQTMGKYLNTLVAQGFKVAISWLILAEPNFLYENAITPIISSGFEFGLSLSPADSLAQVEQFAGKYTFDNSDKLSSNFLAKVMGAVEGYNNMAAAFPALGRALICNAWTDLVPTKLPIFPHLSVLIEGCLVYIFGLMIILGIGFYLLDCALHLCILCCIMPLLVASWPFTLTSRYTKTGWDMLLNIFFRFVMAGVVLATAFELINQVMSQQGDIKTAVESGDVSAIEQSLDISGLQFLLLIVCCMIAMKIIKESETIARKFADGARTGSLGANLGGTAASAATAIAKGAGHMAGKGAMAAGGAIAEASGLKGGAQAVKNKVKGGIQAVAGRMGLGSKARMNGDKSNGGKNSGGTPTP